MTRHHPLVQAAVRNFITYNPLFLFSALLLLGGAWLVNPPGEGGGRDPLRVFQLFGAVQLYELVLLGAAALLARRAGLARDVRNLSLVLAPFLMDISCTNSITAEQTGTWGGHLLAILAILAVVAGKGWIVSRLLGLSLRPLTWAALLAGPLAVTAAPLAASFLAHHGFSPAEEALAGGLTLAGLVLLWGLASERDEADLPALRALAPIVLGVATWHALGTAWAHTGSLLYVLGPALIALGPVLPRLAWPGARDAWTPLLLPAAGALLCGLPGLDGREPWLGASAWQLGLFGLAAAHGLGFARQRTLPFLLGVLAACDLAACGASLGESLRHVGGSPAEPAALLALFAYGLVLRAHGALVLGPLLAAAVLVARLRLVGGSGLVSAGAGLEVVAAGLLLWTHRAHGRGRQGAAWRFVGCTLLWLPAYLVAARGGALADLAALGGRATVAGLLALALYTRLRCYAVPALLLPLEGLRLAAPTSTTGWGALGITGAFVAVGLGVLVSLRREALLAWLERGAAEEPDPTEPAPGPEPRPTPIAVGAPGSSRPALVVASALGALLVPLVVFAAPGGERGARDAVLAIGALKTVSVAQTLFRDGDRDGDGVLDHARSLRELRDAGLIDDALGVGVKNGYRFELVAGPDPERQWMATANPLHGEPGARSFAVNHDGVIVYDTTPIALDQACDLPTWRYRAIGR